MDIRFTGRFRLAFCAVIVAGLGIGLARGNPPVPPNDTPATAQLIGPSVPAIAYGTNNGATNDVGTAGALSVPGPDVFYRFTPATTGTYRVEIEKTGFKKFSRDTVGLGVSTVGRVDAVLSPGSVQETIQVTGEAALLQAENAEVARNFESTSVTELPIADRSAQAVAGLMAGVGLPVRYGGGPLEDAQTTYLFNANGQPPGYSGVAPFTHPGNRPLAIG